MPKPVEPRRQGAESPSGAEELPVVPEIYALRPWYHDFRRLGLRTEFGDPVGLRQRLRGIAASWIHGSRWRRDSEPAPGLAGGSPPHRVNQRTKESWLLPRLRRCVEELDAAPRCLDLFCADGYYSCALAQMRPDASVLGVDREEREIERARAAAGALELAGARFVAADVHDFLAATEDRFDLILCAGGLYHLTEPWRVLERTRRIGARFLVVQSVVTLESEDVDYFVTPAPRWRHGSRFSHARLRVELDAAGWRVVDEARAELPGNLRRSDRGSSFFLCDGDIPTESPCPASL